MTQPQPPALDLDFYRLEAVNTHWRALVAAVIAGGDRREIEHLQVIDTPAAAGAAMARWDAVAAHPESVTPREYDRAYEEAGAVGIALNALAVAYLRVQRERLIEQRERLIQQGGWLIIHRDGTPYHTTDRGTAVDLALPLVCDDLTAAERLVRHVDHGNPAGPRVAVIDADFASAVRCGHGGRAMNVQRRVEVLDAFLRGAPHLTPLHRI